MRFSHPVVLLFPAPASVRIVGIVDISGTRMTLGHTGHDCVEAIDDIKYSPNGRLLAVGSHDNFVDVYEVNNRYSSLNLSHSTPHTSLYFYPELFLF